MKKVVKFLSFAFLGSFLLVGTALAGNRGENAKTPENAFREQLTGALSNIAFQDGNEVKVYFTLSSENGFKLNKVSGENSELTSEVEKILSAKSFTVESNLEGKYIVTVKFKDVTSF